MQLSSYLSTPSKKVESILAREGNVYQDTNIYFDIPPVRVEVVMARDGRVDKSMPVHILLFSPMGAEKMVPCDRVRGRELREGRVSARCTRTSSYLAIPPITAASMMPLRIILSGLIL